jgi:hypothetical protein
MEETTRDESAGGSLLLKCEDWKCLPFRFENPRGLSTAEIERKQKCKKGHSVKIVPDGDFMLSKY